MLEIAFTSLKTKQVTMYQPVCATIFVGNMREVCFSNTGHCLKKLFFVVK